MPRALVVAVAVALVCAAVLSGCGGARDAEPAAPAVVHPHWPGCAAVGGWRGDAGGPPPDRGSVPSGFDGTEARVCGSDQRVTAAGDLVVVDLERKAAPTPALLSYLDRPSQRSFGGGCPAMAWTPPWLVLLDASGGWTAPLIPTDACGFGLGIFDEPGPPYVTLRYQEVSAREGKVVESAAARRAGCAMAWKDVVALEAKSAERAAMVAHPFAGREVLSCTYTVRPGEPGAGTFTRGETLSGYQRAELVAVLAVQPAATSTCSTASDRFVVLQPADGGGAVYVELTGCRRVLLSANGGPGRLAQATPELLGLLAG
jgi:hypothetical protein